MTCPGTGALHCGARSRLIGQRAEDLDAVFRAGRGEAGDIGGRGSGERELFCRLSGFGEQADEAAARSGEDEHAGGRGAGAADAVRPFARQEDVAGPRAIFRPSLKKVNSPSRT